MRNDEMKNIQKNPKAKHNKINKKKKSTKPSAATELCSDQGLECLLWSFK